jgi:tRNA1(Val) A37 N6-methylase TrmN6
MRLAARIKMGYYPTPLSVTNRIKSFISVSDNQKINALDPCCGEGLALKHFAEGFDCETYGIELDNYRAEQAKTNLNRILKGSYTDARIANGCFSVLFLNPPYDDETLNNGIVTSSERKEKVFFKDTIKYLHSGGLLIYIIPQHRFDKSIAKILSYRFRDFRIYKFHGEEYEAFKQIVVFAVKKKKAGVVMDDFRKLAKVRDENLPELPFIEKPAYTLPKAKKVTLFRSSVIDIQELEKEAKMSPLWRKLEELARVDVEKTERPPLPLHQGHLALMLATGMLSGVVGSGEERHVVKGNVKKVVINQTEYNAGKIEERQLDKYQVNIKFITIKGEIKELV